MLGFGPISSRSISGSPFSLIAIPMTMAATGAIVTLGGTANGNNYLTMAASGPIVTFGGTADPLVAVFREMAASGPIVTIGGLAVPTWTQAMSATGAIVELTGRPVLLIAGKPFVVRMISEPFRVRESTENYRVKMVAAPYLVRRVR